MKTILSLLLVMALNLSAFAQSSDLQNNHRLKPSKSETLFQGLKSSKSVHPKTAAQLLKSVNAPSHRLDSIVAAGYMKMFFTYDAQNRAIEQVQQEFDLQWNNTMKMEYEYDSNGYLWKTFEYNWDTNANDWVFNYRNEYQYDTEGRVIVEIYGYYETTEAVWYDTKEEYSWDANGDNTETLTYNYDNANQVWLISSKTVKEFDAYHHEIASNWYYWDLGTMTWMNSSRDEYDLDAQGNIVFIRGYYWDDFNQEWILSYQSMAAFTYDANLNITEEINAYWESWDSIWINSYKIVSTYDTYGNMLTQEYYSYDASAEAWIPEDKQEFEYDTNVLAENIIAPEDIHGDLGAVNMITGATMYFWVGIGWMPMLSFDLYYSELVSVPSIDQISFEVYPNPIQANQVLHLTYPQSDTFTLMVMDMQGRELKKLILNGESTLSLQDLSPGVYFLKMNQKDSNSLVKRIVVQ